MKINKFKQVFYKIGQYSDEKLEELYNGLPKSRKIRVDNVKNKIYREFLIVEFFIVINQLGLSAKKDFSYNKMGKPYFKNQTMHFSISHSQNLLVVAFSNYSIGVDIQHYLNFDSIIAKNICNEKELKKIENSTKKEKIFTKLWTQKESVIKLKGLSMYVDTKNLLENSSYKIFTKLKKDYAISVAIQENFKE